MGGSGKCPAAKCVPHSNLIPPMLLPFPNGVNLLMKVVMMLIFDFSEY